MKRRKTVAYGLGAWALTQLVFVVTLVPFRIHGPAKIWVFAKGMFVSAGADLPPAFQSLRDLQQFAAIVVFLLLYHATATGWGGRMWERFQRAPAPVRGVAYGLAIVYLFVYVPLSAGTFVYANF